MLAVPLLIVSAFTLGGWQQGLPWAASGSGCRPLVLWMSASGQKERGGALSQLLGVAPCSLWLPSYLFVCVCESEFRGREAGAERKQKCPRCASAHGDRSERKRGAKAPLHQRLPALFPCPLLRRLHTCVSTALPFTLLTAAFPCRSGHKRCQK